MSRSPPARVLLSADQAATGNVGQSCRLAITQGDVDVLALA